MRSKLRPLLCRGILLLSLLVPVIFLIPTFTEPQDMSVIEGPASNDSVLTLATQDTSPFIINLTSPTNFVRLTETALNDSSAAKNVAFAGNENKTVYIRLPKHANIVEAKFNLSGHTKQCWDYYNSGLGAGVADIAIGNLSSDIGDEIAVLGYSGLVVLNSTGDMKWSNTSHTFKPSSTNAEVAIGEISSSYAFAEIAVASTARLKLFVLNASGSEVMSKSYSGEFYAVGIGELAADVGDEIIVGSPSKITYAYNSSGSEIWTYELDDWTAYTIETGDVTSNEFDEVLVTGINNVYLLNSSGYCIWKRSFEGRDGAIDNKENMVAIANPWENKLTVLDSNGQSLWNASFSSLPLAVTFGDLAPDEGNEIAVGCQNQNPNYYNIHVFNSSGSLLWISPPFSGINGISGDISSIAIGDIFADEGNELIFGGNNLFEVYAVTNPPLYPYFDVGSDGDIEWSFDKFFDHRYGPRTTIDVSSELNDYLQTAIPDENGLVDVPLVLHSDTASMIMVSDISITFDYNTSYLYNISYISPQVGYLINRTAEKCSVDVSYAGFCVDNNAAIAKVDGTEYPIKTYNSRKYVQYNETIARGSLWANHTVWWLSRSSLETAYPWPMFRHDPARSGYSDSPAPDTNHTLWSCTIGAGYSSPAVIHGMVFVGSEDHRILALNATTGSLIWDFMTGDVVRSSPAIADGKVFVGSYDGYVYALNATTGSLIWRFQTGRVYSSPNINEGTVFVSSLTGYNYALNATTGSLIWQSQYVAETYSSPAVSGDKVIIGHWHTIKAYNKRTGGIVWQTGFWQDIIYSSPAISYGKVFIGTLYGGAIHALDESTGSPIWSFPTGDNIYSSPAVAKGRVFAASCNGNIYALNATTGSLLWNFTSSPDTEIFSSPAVADGKVFIGSAVADGKFYALDETTGRLIWKYETGSIESSPAVADDRVFIAAASGALVAIGPIHDMAVTNITSSASEVLYGNTVSIHVGLENQGMGSENFNLTVLANNTNISFVGLSLPSGSSTTVTLFWRAIIDPGLYSLSAIASRVLAETDLQDNRIVDGIISVVPLPIEVNITEVVSCNQTGGPKDVFTRGSLAYFRVTVDITSFKPEKILITINIYDSANTTIGVSSFHGPITTGESTFILGLQISSSAHLGNATVYANAYTDWPHNGGVPYCPEISAALQIVGAT